MATRSDVYAARAQRVRLANERRDRDEGRTIRLWSYAPGKYRVVSTTDPAVKYSVQLNGDVGVCDCIGHLSHGTNCQHIKAALAAERENPTQ